MFVRMHARSWPELSGYYRSFGLQRYLAAVRILLWHGYLLTGSGSNVYTANVAREWRAEGHDVVVMCQERAAADLPFVDDSFEVGGSVQPLDPRPGGCRVLRPFIDGVLPVYVYDDYEGFVVKRFVDLDDTELERYTELNVSAMAAVIDAFEPDAIVTGHEVMGPAIARRACELTGTRYIAKLHGSALEYAVKLQDRYLAHAVDGLGAAERVVGGSEYMVREASSAIPGWRDRAAVVNPGCDVDLFKPLESARPEAPVVTFVGKLIASKGVHNLLAAIGLMQTTDFRLVVVGYGGFEEPLRELAAALKRGDARTVRAIAMKGETRPLEHLVELVDSGAMTREYFDRVAAVDIEFTGRLEHGPLSKFLPTADVLVVPSVLAEAFGMVAAEAAACAVLPVVPDHSGIAEAGAAVEGAIGKPGFLTFDAADPISSMAAAIDRVLALPRAARHELGHSAARLARERWSWRHVADDLLGHATGTIPLAGASRDRD